MDVDELNNVANRRKICSDVQKLREVVHRENQNIIKLRVSQETAYWNVKQKLRQTQTNHENLQKNMVELQMQYEAVSGKYQDELRYRPETFNKLASTREICDVLENYCERLRATLARCKADQATLCEAYESSSQVVRDLKEQQKQANEQHRLVVNNLQENLRLTTEHNAQMMKFFNAEKQRLESELRDIKAMLREANSLKEELLGAGRELHKDLEACRRDGHKKEDTINNLKRDMKQMFNEFNAQAAQMNNTILKQKEENKELTSSSEALQQALTNQESFTKSVVDQCNALQEKLADLEITVSNKDACIAKMQGTIENAHATNEDLAAQITSANKENQDLLQQIERKNEVQRTIEVELENLTRHIATLDNEKTEALAAKNKLVNALKTLESRVQAMTAAGNDLMGQVQEAEKKMQDDREVMQNQIEQLRTALEEKERELDNKNGTISKLMGDVKHGRDVQTELQSKIDQGRREVEDERRKGEELLAKVTQLQGDVKEKDAVIRSKDREFMKNIKIIKEMGADKEQLKQTIEAMQNKIDNVQKELNNPATRARPLTAADFDDNAIMMVPSSPTFAPPRASQQRAAHVANDEQMILNFMSDSSMGCSLDPTEVNRRFEAISRGQPLPPVHISALKRRRRADSPAPNNAQPRHRPQQHAEDNVNSAAQNKKEKERMFFKTNKTRRGRDSSKQ